jgi:hypothetical protein
MPTHTLSVGEDSFLAIKEVQKDLENRGFPASINRTVAFLAQFFNEIKKASREIINIQKASERADAWEKTFVRVYGTVPLGGKMTLKKKSSRAPLELRVLVFQQFLDRFGFAPTMDLVAEIIDNNGLIPLTKSTYGPAATEIINQLAAKSKHYGTVYEGDKKVIEPPIDAKPTEENAPRGLKADDESDSIGEP